MTDKLDKLIRLAREHLRTRNCYTIMVFDTALAEYEEWLTNVSPAVSYENAIFSHHCLLLAKITRPEQLPALFEALQILKQADSSGYIKSAERVISRFDACHIKPEKESPDSIGGGVTHECKCFPENFQPILDGTKTCELRIDDRDPKYAVGDELEEREFITGMITSGEGFEGYVEIEPKYTGRTCRVLVTHIQRGYGLDPRYVAMSIKRIMP